MHVADEIVQDKTEAKVKRDMMIDRARERDDVKQFLHLQAREEARKTHRADTVHRRKSLFLRGLQAKYEAMERKVCHITCAKGPSLQCDSQEDEARLGSALGGRKEEQQKQLEYDQQLKAIQLVKVHAHWVTPANARVGGDSSKAKNERGHGAKIGRC